MMKLKLNLTLTAAAFAAIALTGCNSVVQEKLAPNTLAAVKASSVNMAALAADPIWAKAQALNVEVNDGANFGGTGKTAGTLKAAYTSDTLYMLVQYKDPTNSVRRGPYQKQADGTWKQLKDPANKGGFIYRIVYEAEGAQ